MTDRLRRVFLSAASICYLAAAASWAQDSVTVSVPQARIIAQNALLSNNPQAALDIARGLLQADPKDPHTLLIISAAQAQLGNNRQGHKAARLAYAHAKSPAVKLDAAQMAARHALRHNRLTLTQIWLRRASLHAPGKTSQERIAKDYAAVRAANPWGFRLDMGLRPSNNVNNGSDATRLTVDGDYTGGELLGSAQALSGIVGNVDLAVSYRLRGDARSRTEMGARLYVQRVSLSSEARAKLRDAEAAGQPTQSESDFGSTYVETFLGHVFAIGERPGDSAGITAAVGKSWYGEERQQTSFRLDGQRIWAVTPHTDLTLAGSTISAKGHNGIADSNSVGLRISVAREIENGDRVSLSFGVLKADSDFANQRYDSATLRLGYGFKNQWGPAKVSTSLTLAAAEYSDYITARFVPTGGFVGGLPVVTQVNDVTPRDDRSAYVSLNLFFPDYDYAGFAPEVTLRAGKRDSNVSRFESSQLSVSVGIQSKF